jgi:hypothetical protein
MDNLNIHTQKSLADVFGAEMATKVWDRFTVHYTRQLAQSSGDRNRDCLAAMLGCQTNPRPKDPAARSPCLEAAHEP